jgi:hypothetical protein
MPLKFYNWVIIYSACDWLWLQKGESNLAIGILFTVAIRGFYFLKNKEEASESLKTFCSSVDEI